MLVVVLQRYGNARGNRKSSSVEEAESGITRPLSWRAFGQVGVQAFLAEAAIGKGRWRASRIGGVQVYLSNHKGKQRSQKRLPEGLGRGGRGHRTLQPYGTSRT